MYRASLSRSLSDVHKCSSYLQENMTDPSTSHADGATRAPFQRAFGVDVPFYEWMETPGRESRLHRFGLAMLGVEWMQPPPLILSGQ